MRTGRPISLLILSCGANAPWLIVKALREELRPAVSSIASKTEGIDSAGGLTVKLFANEHGQNQIVGGIK